MVKIRYAIPVFAAIVALLVAGCGGGGSGDSSSGSDLANLAPPGSLVFAEGQLQPKGELKQNVDSVAKVFTGGEGLGAFVISELESSARQDGESLDFAKEVEPWLGEKGGVAFEHLEGGELSEPLIAIESTDTAAAQTFIDKRTKQGENPSKDVSYEGVDFKVGGPEDNAVGLIGETVVLAQSEKEFKAAVDASKGESLGGEDRFQKAIANASEGSFADIYVDIGGIIDQSENGKRADQAKGALQAAGIDASEATAVASVIPQASQIVVDLSSELNGQKAPAGNASKLLGSLPASSFAAVSFSEFGEQLEEAIDNLDEEGIPPDLKPGELKNTLSQAGIDLDKIAGSLEEGAVFAEGSNLKSLGGALVVTSKSSEAADAIASLGTLLRSARVPGVTAVSGKASGFSISSSELGGKPHRRRRQRRPSRGWLRPGARLGRPQRWFGGNPFEHLWLQGGGLGSWRYADQRLRRRRGGAAACRSPRPPLENRLLGSRSLPEEDQLHRHRPGFQRRSGDGEADRGRPRIGRG